MNRASGLMAALALLMFAGTVLAEGNWRRIGETRYDASEQRAVIAVGADDGRFEAIMLEVAGGDVEVRSLRLIYGNGELDDIALGDVFRPGARSRRIELKRGDRFIKQVIINYRAQGDARISLLGDMSETPTAWEVLGCKMVNFGVERDVIPVGRKEGVFTRIRLSVDESPVEFYEVRVIYANGQPDVLPLRAVITPRQKTQPLDLSGKQRGIDRIELVYRSMQTSSGQARVCASGLHLR